MRFVCESCRAQYMINDEKVGPKGVKVRCRKCGYVILVKRADAAKARARSLDGERSRRRPGHPGVADAARRGGGGFLSNDDHSHAGEEMTNPRQRVQMLLRRLHPRSPEPRRARPPEARRTASSARMKTRSARCSTRCSRARAVTRPTSLATRARPTIGRARG